MSAQSTQAQAATPGGASKSPIRVVIIDDSAVIRGLTKRWLAEDSQIDVVTSFTNGAHAVANIAKYECDVAILDIEMPEMDGLTALPKLLKAVPGLQVIIASTLSLRNADISLRALSLGAADYIAKPESSQGLVGSQDYRRDLIEKVKVLGLARVRKGRTVPTPAPRDPAPMGKPAPKSISLQRPNTAVPKAVIIGSSTGGPQALSVVTGAWKSGLNVPVFIAQHMPPMFTAILAEQITKTSGHPCTEGKDGEIALPGHIYLAPGDHHMILKREGSQVRICLNQDPPVNYCRPAADPLFSSAAAVYGASTLCVVLTGMGHDGREGSRAIVEAGGRVIVQDEATSVVWGMPAAVAEAGLATNVLPLPAVAPEVLRLLGRRAA